MNARNERMDWNRTSQAFRHFDGSLPEPMAERWEYTRGDLRRASSDSFRRGATFGIAYATLVVGAGCTWLLHVAGVL